MEMVVAPPPVPGLVSDAPVPVDSSRIVRVPRDGRCLAYVLQLGLFFTPAEQEEWELVERSSIGIPLQEARYAWELEKAHELVDILASRAAASVELNSTLFQDALERMRKGTLPDHEHIVPVMRALNARLVVQHGCGLEEIMHPTGSVSVDAIITMVEGDDDHKTGHWDWLKKLRCNIEIDPVPDSVAAKASMHDRDGWEALTAASAPMQCCFDSPSTLSLSFWEFGGDALPQAPLGADAPPQTPSVTLPDIWAGDAPIVPYAAPPPEPPSPEPPLPPPPEPPSLIRVACIGDSNTVGTGLVDRSLSYAHRLEAKLGKNYLVQSFGRVGATVASGGSVSYVDTTRL